MGSLIVCLHRKGNRFYVGVIVGFKRIKINAKLSFMDENWKDKTKN